MHYEPIIDDSWSDEDQAAYFAFLERHHNARRRTYRWSTLFLAFAVLAVWGENWFIHHFVAVILLAGYIAMCFVCLSLVIGGNRRNI
jgi:hypothetical protein